MSSEPMECDVEASPGPQLPDQSSPNDFDLPYQISVEHCYSRLVPFRSSPAPCSTDQTASFKTTVLFENCVRDKSRLTVLNRSHCGYEEVDTHEGNSDSEDELVDVVSVDQPPHLPYNEKKVSSVMVECSRYINLVKVPTENSDLLMARALQDSSYPRGALLRRLLCVLEADHLARLACAQTVDEPIKRKLNTDKAAGQFRKALADVRWETKLIRSCHETLLQVLNNDLLPIYLDILQVLKAKCPALVEGMIHSSISAIGNKVFGVLLKRPWDPVTGLNSPEHQVKFESAPLFVTLPYSTSALGGRRMKMIQTQLGNYGKVYPVILPESLTELSAGLSLEEVSEVMVTASLTRVQELQTQRRPIVLVGFSLAARIAAKVAQIEPVSCLVSIGLPSVGLDMVWNVEKDPFRDCKTPTLFVVGSEATDTSMEYLEELRSSMTTATGLLVIGGGDNLVRLSAEDKASEVVCQSIVDRCILDKVYEFIVYMLPCSLPEDPSRMARNVKHKGSEEIDSAFLTPGVTHATITLSEDVLGANSNNSNSNNSPSVPTAVTRVYHRAPPAPTLGKRLSQTGKPAPKRRSSSQSHTLKRLCQAAPPRALSESLSGPKENYISPPGLLTIPQANIKPLPITPPRNPFAEDVQDCTNLKLDPKTIKQLQMTR